MKERGGGVGGCPGDEITGSAKLQRNRHFGTGGRKKRHKKPPDQASIIEFRERKLAQRESTGKEKRRL